MLIHKLQQIQAKIFDEVPMIGKFTLVSESCNVILKEEQARWSIRIVKGQSSQTSFAGSQWKKMCSKLSSAPHLTHKICPKKPLFYRFSRVDRLLRAHRQMNIFILMRSLGAQTYFSNSILFLPKVVLSIEVLLYVLCNSLISLNKSMIFIVSR